MKSIHLRRAFECIRLAYSDTILGERIYPSQTSWKLVNWFCIKTCVIFDFCDLILCDLMTLKSGYGYATALITGLMTSQQRYTILKLGANLSLSDVKSLSYFFMFQFLHGFWIFMSILMNFVSICVSSNRGTLTRPYSSKAF